MKKSKLLFYMASCILFNTAGAFALDAVPTEDLLLSYMQNDTTLKKTTLEVEKAQLSLNSSKISNGFDVTVSTGTITIKPSSSGTTFTMKPTVQASLPTAANLKVNASSDINFSSETPEMKDAKLTASVDIIGETAGSAKISQLKAERTYTEAVRKMNSQVISTEKSFYTELKNLLNSTSSLISKEKELYNTKNDFEKVKAQGYSTTSSTYRLSQMKVVSAEHEVEDLTRELIHSYVVFYKKCGYDITINNADELFELIPSDISYVDPIDPSSYSKESFTEIESALWTSTINELQRNNSKSFTLSANGGLTYTNGNTSSLSVDAGVTSKFSGLNVSAGVNVPVTSETSSPSITLSASVNPTTFIQKSITTKQNELSEQQEEISLSTAYSNYETKLVDWKQSLSDIQWSKKTYEESYAMYAEVEKELSAWYKQGIISESEYYSARINTKSYYLKKIMNAIDFIIYNDNIRTMFVED